MRRKNARTKSVSRTEGGLEVTNRKVELEKELTFEYILSLQSTLEPVQKAMLFANEDNFIFSFQPLYHLFPFLIKLHWLEFPEQNSK